MDADFWVWGAMQEELAFHLNRGKTSFLDGQGQPCVAAGGARGTGHVLLLLSPCCQLRATPAPVPGQMSACAPVPKSSWFSFVVVVWSSAGPHWKLVPAVLCVSDTAPCPRVPGPS